jgi:hypothetical protein
MTYFDSDIFRNLKMECEISYELYRFTSAYIKYMYDNSHIQWHETFERTGGKERWGHHNKFTEHW